jgi:hypothetical protein
MTAERNAPQPWDFAAFIHANPSSSVIVRINDGTFCGCDIDGDLMADSVVLADRSVVDRTPENLAKPLWRADE